MRVEKSPWLETTVLMVTTDNGATSGSSFLSCRESARSSRQAPFRANEQGRVGAAHLRIRRVENWPRRRTDAKQ